MSWKVNIFMVGFKLKHFFSFYSIINKKIPLISVIMQTQAKCLICFTKTNTKFNAKPKLPLIPKVGSLRTTKSYFSVCQYEMMN